MRKQTFAIVCIILMTTLGILFRPFIRSYPFITMFLILPLLLFSLAFLNQYLLSRRKELGRDIEEEEKYENLEADIISLRPRKPDDNDISYRR